MEPLLKRLTSSRLLIRDKRGFLPANGNNDGQIPDKGVYVLYKEGKAIYVGRSNGIRERLYQHGRKGIMATFAIKLLREKLGIKADYSTEKSVRTLIKDHSAEFEVQRNLVKKMAIQVVKIEDPQVQYIFEAYAAISLGTTKYNTFDPT